MNKNDQLNYIIWLCEHLKSISLSKFAFNPDLRSEISTLLESVCEDLESL